jgi:hypothetical protein
VVAIPWSELHRRAVVLSSLALLAGLSAFTTQHALRLDGGYRDVLALAQLAEPGKRLLPIIVDQYAGSPWTKPYLHAEALYTIERGGSNPYVFATPHILTAASPLKYRNVSDAREFAYVYDEDRGPEDYRGVGGYYDYVLLLGQSSALAAVVGAEMVHVDSRGDATLFARGRSP